MTPGPARAHLANEEAAVSMPADDRQDPKKGSQVSTPILLPATVTQVAQVNAPVRFDPNDNVPPSPFELGEFAEAWTYVARPVTIEQVADGELFAMTHRIVIRPHRKVIEVEMFDGATVTDLLAADETIRALRAGKFRAIPWTMWGHEDPEKTVFSTILGTPSSKASDRIVPCTTTGCDDNTRHHSLLDGEHQPIHRQVIAGGGSFGVYIYLASDTAAPWMVNCDAEELESIDAAALASALNQAAAIASQLNEGLEREAANS